jgi:hydroxyacylglutathione hydrolase
MPLELIRLEVGSWPMNSYVLVCRETGTSAVIDPGAEAERILAQITQTQLAAIFLTHAHPDHVGALEGVKQATGAPVYLHSLDAERFHIPYDIPFEDGMSIRLGNFQVRAVHTPGHTPGMVCLDLGDGRIVVGDTLFRGGPGRTWSASDFDVTMETMRRIVFTWPDETEFYPGHGDSGRIGEERPAFEAFVERGWSAGLQGDVTWE